MLDLREVGEAEWKALKPLLESVPEGVPVLLLDPKPSPSRAAFYRNRERRDFPTPKGKDLVRHLENRAKRLGLRLPGGVAQYLASLEGDLRALERELEKLALLSPPLTLEKVEKVVALRPPSRALTWCAPSWRRTPRRPSCASGASRRRGRSPSGSSGPSPGSSPSSPGPSSSSGKTPGPRRRTSPARGPPLRRPPRPGGGEAPHGRGPQGGPGRPHGGGKEGQGGKDPWLALEAAVLRLAG